MSYQHRQSAVSMRVSFALAAAILFALHATQPVGQFAPTFVATLLLAVFLAFDGLTIRIVGDELRWSFGHFGFPRGRVLLSAIVEASATRTSFWEGWGIRFTRRGWLYNVSGFDAVLIHRADGKRFLLGTDEPNRLVAAIERAQQKS